MIHSLSTPVTLLNLVSWSSWIGVAIGVCGTSVFLVAVSIALRSRTPAIAARAHRLWKAALVWGSVGLAWALIITATTDPRILMYLIAGCLALSVIISIASGVFRVMGHKRFRGITLRTAILISSCAAAVFVLALVMLTADPTWTASAAACTVTATSPASN